MTKIDSIDDYNDEQLVSLLGGRLVAIHYLDGTSIRGRITRFIIAARAEYKKRTIVGLIFDGCYEVGISSQTIRHIELI